MPHREKESRVRWDEGSERWVVKGGILENGERSHDILGSIAVVGSESVPKKQQFQVYKELASVLGYPEREKLLDCLETAIKVEINERNEVFVGFIP
ncbi:hypothetical protein R1sor_015998 [Riccia sorocarpa]|uniref:Uncharacterized protein n=1 Tax=Riccia sorocarpa TaxID=122646 RepID=A0ABD3HJY1_9MARC